MSLSKALDRADLVDAGLTRLVNEIDLVSSDRNRLAAGAFMIALDVHTAIVRLVRSGNTPSAVMLSRSIWEATIRGFWLLECASDKQLNAFAQDNLNRKTWNMIQDLETAQSFDSDTLSAIHSHNSRRLNAMNHVGGPLVVRCISERGIEYNFEDDEIEECVGNATANALLSAVGLAQVANNAELGNAVFALQSHVFRK